MDKLFEWIKKNQKKTVTFIVISIFVLAIGIPILIHVCYIFPAPVWWLDTEWEAGNVLEYYGAILGFLGTAALSMLALYQNYEIKKESDAKQALLDRIEYAKEMPLFRVKNSGCCGNYANLCLSILNISDNVAYDLSVSSFQVENENGEVICESKEAKIRRKELFANLETEIEFKNDNLVGNNLKIGFQLKCKDKFQKPHTYNVSCQIADAKIFKGSVYRIIEL